MGDFFTKDFTTPQVKSQTPFGFAPMGNRPFLALSRQASACATQKTVSKSQQLAESPKRTTLIGTKGPAASQMLKRGDFKWSAIEDRRRPTFGPKARRGRL